MNTIINSYEEYQIWAGQHMGGFPPALFRGHEREFYSLLPTIARENISEEQTLIYEQRLSENFEKAIEDGHIADTKIEVSGSHFLPKWHIGFQMRHLEVPSRLIDFTLKPDVALYFAVNNPQYWHEDGHVWFYKSYDKRYPPIDNMEDVFNANYMHISAGGELQQELAEIDPLNPDKVLLAHSFYNVEDFSSQTGNQRKIKQAGKFIVMKNEWIKYPMDGTFLSYLLEKVIIKAEAKQEMLKVLNEKGLNDYYLLPDISVNTKKIIDGIIIKSRQEANLSI